MKKYEIKIKLKWLQQILLDFSLSKFSSKKTYKIYILSLYDLCYLYVIK